MTQPSLKTQQKQSLQKSSASDHIPKFLTKTFDILEVWILFVLTLLIDCKNRATNSHMPSFGTKKARPSSLKAR